MRRTMNNSNTSQNQLQNLLEIKNLHVSVADKEILCGVDLNLPLGEVHVLMGPNGSGKSTLAAVIMGHPKYKITKGTILLNGEDVTTMSPDVRAKKGLFLSFQYPVEIAGVTVENFLRLAYNTLHSKTLSVIDFHKLLLAHMDALHMDHAFSRRYLNEGFSGGEKKRMEMLQMSILDPAYAILDETDSGLDVDALKVVADAINRRADALHATLIITHFSRLLMHVHATHVHVMQDGKIVKSGGKELVHEIEKEGYLDMKQ